MSHCLRSLKRHRIERADQPASFLQGEACAELEKRQRAEASGRRSGKASRASSPVPIAAGQRPSASPPCPAGLWWLWWSRCLLPMLTKAGGGGWRREWKSCEVWKMPEYHKLPGQQHNTKSRLRNMYRSSLWCYCSFGGVHYDSAHHPFEVKHVFNECSGQCLSLFLISTDSPSLLFLGLFIHE